MKKKLILCMIISAVIALTGAFTGCAANKQQTADTENAPNYQDSDKEFTIWAYGATCDDWYQVNGKRYYFPQGSLQTPETTKQYKDAGFNLLFIDYTFQEDSLVSGYDFENGKLKKVMDMAHEQGLKCFISQMNLRGLSDCEESRINPEKADGEKFFESEEALAERAELILTGLKDHPAFYGVSLTDEPAHTKFTAISQVYKAIKTVCPDAYVMMNLLPFADTNQHKTMYADGGTDMTADEAYLTYLNEYYEKIGKYCGYIQYDDYPIMNTGLLSTWLHCAQIVSEFAAEKGLERHMAFQTTKYSDRRAPKGEDMLWQLNMGMAFGTKQYSYYTYYPTVNVSSKLPDETAFIVNRTGEPNPIYYTLKDFHGEMQFNAKALMNFEYKGLTYSAKVPLPSGMGYFGRVEKDEMYLLKDYSFTVKLQSGGAVLITELYDETAQRYGYYAVNATDPAVASEVSVTLDFGDYKNAQIYQFAQAQNVLTDGGKITVNLATGRGAFIMPY